MNTIRPHRAASTLSVLLCAWGAIAIAQAQPSAPAAAPPPATATAPAPEPDAASVAASAAAAIAADAVSTAVGDEEQGSDRQEWSDRPPRSHGHRRHNHDLVSIGHGSDLPSGTRADSVVSIFGSSTSAGEAGDVVSILGDTRVSGPVKDSAVAVLGSTYVDGTIGRDVVAVLGNVELGPHADVGGDVVAVGGTVQRDPAAIVHGGVHSVAGQAGGFVWLRPWIDHCLLYARPLALEPGLAWAWGLALSLLALYIGLALVFREGVNRCVQTLETQPGMTALAALLTVLLAPGLLVLLCITVVGLAAVPLFVFGLFCAGLFGKAVMLAWIGRRCLGGRAEGPLAYPAFTVFVGGVIVLVLYLVPVLGFVVYKLLGLFGLGAVVYTLILAARAWQAARNHGPAASAPRSAVPGGAPPSAAPDAAHGSAASSTDAAHPEPADANAAPAAAAAAPGPAPIVTAALPRAGFWIRMAALLLDALLVGFLMGVLSHVFHMELVVLAIYGAVMWKLRGSTIGGIVFDLQVVRLDGRPIDWEIAIVRALGCFLSLAVAGLGFFWIAFDDGKQAWHDKIAGTVVVRVAKGAPPR